MVLGIVVWSDAGQCRYRRNGHQNIDYESLLVVMGMKVISSHVMISQQERGSRSIPREVGTSAPDSQPVFSSPVEFPQTITTTIPVPLQPRSPLSASTPVLEPVRQSPSVPAERSE